MHNEIFLKLEQANNGAPMNDRKNNIYSQIFKIKEVFVLGHSLLKLVKRNWFFFVLSNYNFTRTKM